MAPLITHLVVGERVFPQIRHLDPATPVYGAFLLGCVLVDVNHFSDFDRRQTHFVGRLEEDGEAAFKESCENFLDQLGTLLRRPWAGLSSEEQAFVAGYLCHLATDEPFKAFAWKLMQNLNLSSLANLPLPTDVILTAFSVLSAEMFLDFGTVAAALGDVAVPDVLTHVPHQTFQRMWKVVRDYALDGRTLQAYLAMLERSGKSRTELRQVRQQHEDCWESALTLIHDAGSVAPYLQAATERAANTVHRLWTKKTAE